MSARILVVEDNADLARALSDNLALEGYAVGVVGDGESARRAIVARAPDLVILDVMLPGRDGFSVLRDVRAAGYAGAVIMRTARGAEADKVRGLRAGADDYLTKPFGLLELLARVDAQLRRAARAAAPKPATAQRATFGEVEVEPASHVVRRAGREVVLAPKEFALLLALLARDGAVASREELLAEVWGHSGVAETRTVDTHIAELRRKLERDPSAPRHILTARKAGYRLQR